MPEQESLLHVLSAWDKKMAKNFQNISDQTFITANLNQIQQNRLFKPFVQVNTSPERINLLWNL